MRRVTSILPLRENHSKPESKPIFDMSWSWSETKNLSSSARSYSAVLASELQMLTEPTFTSDNNSSNNVEFENFWPSTLDKESERAARILYSFCKTGFHVDLEQVQDQPSHSTTNCLKPLVVTPYKVIQNAVALAIFTASRPGLWMSGAGGSGVLVARKEDGDWSPPAGILLQTSGLSFAGGVDIYDCMIVINDRKALSAFTSLRSTVGGEFQVPTGPLWEVGSEDEELFGKSNPPMLTYLKSRGFHANFSMDGIAILARIEEHKRFYGRRIGASEIFAGNVRHSSPEVKLLLETIKFAEGCGDSNEQVLEQLAWQLSPGDIYAYSPRSSSFGIPEAEDPDPFGVLALERAGLEIRESGSRSRPSSTQFEYHPSPNSPVFARFNRRSIDTQVSRSNRGSYVSTRTRTSIDRGTQTISMATQTDELWTPNTSPTVSDYKQIIQEQVQEFEETEITKDSLESQVDLGKTNEYNKSTSINGHLRAKLIQNKAKPVESQNINKDDAENSELEDEDEEPVIFEAASAQATILQSAKKAGGGLVNIPKRGPPPPVPPRSASRGTIDTSTLNALRRQFERVELCNSTRQSCDDKFLSYPHALIQNTSMPEWSKGFEGKTLRTGISRSPTKI